MDLNKLEEDSNGIVVQPNSGFVTTYNSFIRNPNISSNAKILYLYLLGYSGRGQAFPSVARIEREIGWRRQKITSVTKELEEFTCACKDKWEADLEFSDVLNTTTNPKA